MRVTQKEEGAFDHLYYEQVVFELLFKSILIITRVVRILLQY